jgi:hypothetical protein
MNKSLRRRSKLVLVQYANHQVARTNNNLREQSDEFVPSTAKSMVEGI